MWGGPHSTLELGGGGGNIIPGSFLLSQYEWLWERNIFSQSVDIPGGGDPIPYGGDPIQLLKGGEGVVTLSQVAFYHLNMNGYGNIIFSVCWHPRWGDPIPCGGRGTPSQVGGPHPMWGGPHSTLELGGGGGNIIPGCFLPSQYEWLWERNIFSQSVDIPGGGGPHPTWGDPIQLLKRGEGVVTLSQVAFYQLNMNGYGNVIFSVCWHPRWGDPIPCGGEGAPSHMGGPHPMWGGPHSTLELGEGEGVVTLSQVAFYCLNMNGYGNVIFSVSLLTSQVGGTPSHVGRTPSLVHEGVFFDMQWAVSLFGSCRWTLLFKYLTFLYLLYLEVFLEVQ